MRALIIEDEAVIARELCQAIAEVANDVEIIATLPSIKTARKWFIQNPEPDLMFMDIQLSDGVSFEIFEQFQLKCPVIFTTAYDEYAIMAFKKNGIDYLLKPVEMDELKNAIDKCRKIIASEKKPFRDFHAVLDELRISQQKKYRERFVVQVRHQWVPVDTEKIALFYRDNLNYLVTFEGEKFIVTQTTLDEIETQTNPDTFYRANRQYIINIDAIQTVQPHDNQKLTVTLKPPLKIQVDVSREKAPAFKKWFDR